MKNVLMCLITFSVSTLFSYSQDNEIDRQLKQTQKELNIQLELLETYRKQLENEVELLKLQYEKELNNDKQLKKSKSQKTSPTGIDLILGITNKEAIGYQATFTIEVDTFSHTGLEIGLFIDTNNIHIQKLEVPAESFIFYLGYTRQLNFMSTKTNTVNTRFSIGGAFGTESVNNGETALSSGAMIVRDDGVIYGGYTGISSLFKISDKFSALIRYTNFLTSSNVSLHKFIVGAGIYYKF
ncbi:conjugal transfer protein TraO [Cellulophaga sp. HaHa_2_1]|uniref:conjugal transfer protein TraO n=1 Tax=Cellulophaga sp. HaHa_2_1 TaxID=2749994 RepID=UPI001C4E83A4|nr:conjugal transfer protein TraO [Cellulophaga sp. HaHa_2_1]QXP52547.1 conjugal transfer protein TraO [Cellulophaga sp. HaHa_2_1]